MAIDNETDRLMRNWAAWRITSGRESQRVISSAYTLEARGRRASVSVPMFDPEASEVDDAVKLLETTVRQAVLEFWLRAGPVVDKARRLGCTSRTLYRRLERGYRAINAYRTERRRRLRPVAMPRIA